MTDVIDLMHGWWSTGRRGHDDYRSGTIERVWLAEGRLWAELSDGRVRSWPTDEIRKDDVEEILRRYGETGSAQAS